MAFVLNVVLEVLGRSALVGGTVGLVDTADCVGRGNGVGRIGLMAVSYTHLTLPTIYSV